MNIINVTISNNATTKFNNDETSTVKPLLLKFSVHSVKKGSFADKSKIISTMKKNNQ